MLIGKQCAVERLGGGEGEVDQRLPPSPGSVPERCFSERQQKKYLLSAGMIKSSRLHPTGQRDM